MSSKKFKTYVTPAFTACFPHLTVAPDEYMGKKTWNVTGIFEKNDPVLKQLNKILEEALVEAAERHGDEWQGDRPHTPMKQHTEKDPDTGKPKKTGKVKVVFRSKAEFQKKDGSVVSRVLPVFDNYGGIVKEEVWGGSEICVAFNAISWCTAMGEGIQFQMQGVQVKKLVTKGSNAGDYSGEELGFKFEEKPDDEFGGEPELNGKVPVMDSEIVTEGDSDDDSDFPF